MYGLTYKRLLSVMDKERPFRGTENRFPLFNRRENTKYFLVREENGEKTFDIVYGYLHDKIEYTKEQAKAITDANGSVFEWPDANNVIHYYNYVRKPDIVGVVRSDNTFEFTSTDYHQGDRMFLSRCSSGFFVNDSLRGGLVYRAGSRSKFPVYKNMRVDCTSMKPAEYFKIVGKAVNRKVGKDVLSRYGDFYKTSEVMMKAMDYDTFIKAAAQVATEHDVFAEKHANTISIPLEKTAESLVDTAPFDAMVLYMLSHQVPDIVWPVRRIVSGYPRLVHSNERSTEQMFGAFKRRMNTEIYKANPQVFTDVTYEVGDYYPASMWGYSVVDKDGKEKQLYD